ncbi:hypothetical protein M378DRAFT_12989 [Amanita muscaria Koide BX008]|uniref:Uncharacterized protein n=1 Tax=Amanita muscaria (strain Koide BX008) TaxID=946122 RepID=A0A0C2X0E1_AMAMK|nr:hypothetical protein M378DRAFT_12989 [Amanita muscaria Koide BX008]
MIPWQGYNTVVNEASNSVHIAKLTSTGTPLADMALSPRTPPLAESPLFAEHGTLVDVEPALLK